MPEIKINLILDFYQANRVGDILSVRGDYCSRFIRAKLTSNGSIVKVSPGAVVKINARRPDGMSDSFDGIVNDDGTVDVPVTEWMLDVVGRVMCSISIITESTKKTTSNFYIISQENPNDSGTILQDNPQKIDLKNRPQGLTNSN